MNNTIQLKITGVSALLLHSDRLSNPLDSMTKAHKLLTSKRKKTDQDQIDIARSEFLSSLYPAPESMGICVPSAMVRAVLVGGAKKVKMGTEVKTGTMIVEDWVKLSYKGPSTPEELWNNPDYVDVRGVKVSTSRIMRYRPKFPVWSLNVSILFDDLVLTGEQIKNCMEIAGKYVGMGDYRPEKSGTFGRFIVE